MSNDRQKGRADAAGRRWDPPSSFCYGLFNTAKESARMETRYQQYREGYNDKQRQMKK